MPLVSRISPLARSRGCTAQYGYRRGHRHRHGAVLSVRGESKVGDLARWNAVGIQPRGEDKPARPLDGVDAIAVRRDRETVTPDLSDRDLAPRRSAQRGGALDGFELAREVDDCVTRSLERESDRDGEGTPERYRSWRRGQPLHRCPLQPEVATDCVRGPIEVPRGHPCAGRRAGSGKGTVTRCSSHTAGGGVPGS